MNNQRDNLKAGIFVLVGMLLGFIVIITLSDFNALFEQKQTLRVRYGLADGLKGIKPGAAVTLGDQLVGSVTGIEDVLEQSPDGQTRVTGMIAEIEIPKRYQIYRDAIIEVKAPPLGSNSKLNIRSVGRGEPYVLSGEPIDGDIASNALTQDMVRDAGIEAEQRKQIQEIIANVRDLTAALKNDVPVITSSVRTKLETIDPLIENANAALANVRSVTDEIKGRSDVWLGRVDNITESADASLTTVKQMVADKETDVRVAIENVRDVTQQAKDQTMAQVTSAMERANTALENLQTSSAELKTFLIGQRPTFERMTANLQLSAAQLKLAMIEVRRSPWRLIYQPKDEELEHDNLYDAARSFALAAEALDSTAATLHALAEKQPGDTEHLKQMTSYLEELFSRFQEAETEFWQAMGKPGTQAP